jgi:hypothetical protein
LSDNLKSELERAARLRGVPLSVVLEQAARVWLSQNAADPVEDEESQRKLHAAAERYIGFEVATLVQCIPHRNERFSDPA